MGFVPRAVHVCTAARCAYIEYMYIDNRKRASSSYFLHLHDDDRCIDDWPCHHATMTIIDHEHVHFVVIIITSVTTLYCSIKHNYSYCYCYSLSLVLIFILWLCIVDLYKYMLSSTHAGAAAHDHAKSNPARPARVSRNMSATIISDSISRFLHLPLSEGESREG